MASVQTVDETGIIPLRGRLDRRLDEVVATIAVILALAAGIATGTSVVFGLAVACAGVGIVAAVLEPRLGAIGLGLVACLAGLQRGFPIPQFRLSELMIVGLALVVALRVRPGRLPFATFDWLALVYAIATLALGTVNLIQHHFSPTFDRMSVLLAPFQFLLLYRSAALLSLMRNYRNLILRVALLSTFPISAIALLQTINFPGIRNWVTSVTGVDAYLTPGFTAVGRATGLFQHWHLLAGFSMCLLLLATALLLRRSYEVLSRRALIAVIVSAAIGIFASLTITVMIGAAAGLLIVGVHAGRTRVVLRWGTILAVSAAVVFSPILIARFQEQTAHEAGTHRSALVPQTVSYRFDVWREQYLPAIERNLSTGYGPDLPPTITFQYSESVYFTLLLRGGIPLLALYGALMFEAFQTARFAPRDDEVSSALAGTVIALVLVLIPMSFLFPYFVSSGLPHLWWLFLGVLVGSSAAARSRAPALARET
jgi:hypothetical protein